MQLADMHLERRQTNNNNNNNNNRHYNKISLTDVMDNVHALTQTISSYQSIL